MIGARHTNAQLQKPPRGPIRIGAAAAAMFWIDETQALVSHPIKIDNPYTFIPSRPPNTSLNLGQFLIEAADKINRQRLLIPMLRIGCAGSVRGFDHR
jgi:hypothetical protein